MSRADSQSDTHDVEGAIENLIRAADPDDERTEDVLRSTIADSLHYAIYGPDHHLEERFRAQSMSNASLGALIREYVSESSHQGWEGFTVRDQMGINSFIRDMMMYHDLCREDEGVLERAEADQIFRDEVCADMIREVENEANPRTRPDGRTYGDLLNEAIRNSIDIDALREFLPDDVVAEYTPEGA